MYADHVTISLTRRTSVCDYRLDKTGLLGGLNRQLWETSRYSGCMEFVELVLIWTLLFGLASVD
jgi:hypothetical protein